VLAPFALCAACSSPKMAVPPDVASGSEVMEVTDRSAWSGALADEGFRLGPYKVTDVDHKWDSSSGWGVGAFSKEKTAGGYKFTFSAGKTSLVGKCATEAKDTNIGLGSGMALDFKKAKLGCSCEAGGALSSVVLQGDGEKFTGELDAAPSDKYMVKSVHAIEGGSDQGKPSGYRVDGDAPVGAVEVMFPGRVWLKKGLSDEQRAEVSCLFAGLILYKPPEDKH
jgi:hypothetical protein